MWFRFLHPQIPDFQILSKHTSMESVCIQLSDDAHISEWFCAPGQQLQKIKTLMNGSSKNGLFGNRCNKRTHLGSFIIACRDQWCSAGASEELRLRLKSHLASPILTELSPASTLATPFHSWRCSRTILCSSDLPDSSNPAGLFSRDRHTRTSFLVLREKQTSHAVSFRFVYFRRNIVWVDTAMSLGLVQLEQLVGRVILLW